MRSLCLLPLILLVMTLMICVTGCRHTPHEVAASLDRAEHIMESRPDLALSILDSIDSTALTGRADRARYALLLSMALDKNCIDTTGFTILQPAIDYYEKHGTADQRLKTLYYKGRIYMNRGDDDAALTAFLQAARDSADCRDSLALARLYEATGAMYHKQYCMHSFMDVNCKAADIYKNTDDTIAYLRCQIKILYAAELNNDSIRARKAFSIVTKDPQYCQRTGLDVTGQVLRYYKEFGSTQQVDSILSYFEETDTLSISSYSRLDLANIMVDRNHNQKALEQLRLVDAEHDSFLWTVDDSIKYYAIVSYIFDKNNMQKEALDAYKIYLNLIENRHTSLFNDGLLFSKERHDMIVAGVKREEKLKHSIIIALFSLQIAIIVILTVVYLSTIIRKNRHKIVIEKKQLQLNYQNLILDNKQLELQQRLLQAEIKKTRLEKERSEIVSIIMKIQVNELENEKIKLKSILNATRINDIHLRQVLRDRIDLLDGYIKSKITGNSKYNQQLLEIEKNIVNDKRSFLNNLNNHIYSSFPQLKELCVKSNLSIDELDYISLVVLGLSSKEAGVYLGINRVNHFAVKIRGKMNIPKNKSTLSQYIKQMIESDLKSTENNT
ncbi:MAG: hypothetical protein K2H86_03380 [Muribaculaceae bacterium]|nr:hypothetical protein [Muribaculaceae bacterium]